jgi:hypothetical protein
MRPTSTSSLRPPGGLDRGARKLLVEFAHPYPDEIVKAFFQAEAWADTQDYLDGLERVGQAAAAAVIRSELGRTFDPYRDPDPLAVLLNMPDGDFLTAIESVAGGQSGSLFPEARDRANRICEQRGVPYRLAADTRPKFEWVGDDNVEAEALAPALAALDDPRLAGGPHDEFHEARMALREGRPQSFRRAVAESCNAVESGLKVLLIEHGAPVPDQQNVDALLAACRDVGIFPAAVGQKGVPAEQLLTGPARFGNRRGRHGAGPVPHDVEADEAEAVVASAAVALTLIARRLPAQ